MASGQARQASSFESDPSKISAAADAAVVEHRKRRRMQSNRESARRSRMRKQQHLDELVSQAEKLKVLNGDLAQKIQLLTRNFCAVESENAILRTQIAELSDRLASAGSVLRLLEELSGAVIVDSPEFMKPSPPPLLQQLSHDPLMTPVKPWGLSFCTPPALLASATDAFLY